MRRKLFAIALVAMMVLSLPAPVAAESWGGETNTFTFDSQSTASDFENGTFENMEVDGDSLIVRERESDGSSETFEVHEDISSSAYSTTHDTADLVDEITLTIKDTEDNGFAPQGDLILTVNGDDYVKDVQIGNMEEDDVTFSIEETESPVDITVDWTDASHGELVDVTYFGTNLVNVDSAEYTSDTYTITEPKSAEIDMVLDDAEADVTWQALDGDNWLDVASDTTSSTGTVSTELAESYDEWRVNVGFETSGDVREWHGEIEQHSIEYENTAPTLEDPRPSDSELYNDEEDVILEVDVSDPEFGTVQGDTVEVSFYNAEDDTLIGTDTLISNDTASVEWSDTDLGEKSYYVVAEDEWGGESQTDVQTFKTPSEIVIRDETNPDEIIDSNVELEVTFFATDDVITRSTTDGRLNLTGLPNEEMVVQASGDGYVTRQTIIRSISEQQDIYLLPDDADQVTSRFTLEDPTGQFDQQTTRAFVQKPIRQDGQTAYRTIAADELGSQGWATILERDQRYRIVIEDLESGQERSLGPYVATTSEEVTLKVDEIQFSYEDEDLGYRWDAEYRNETDPSVLFAFEADHSIESLTVEITEGGANDTILLSETYSDTESISEVAFIPDEIDGETSTWVVEWEADIVLEQGGETRVETISGSTVVGPDQMPVDVDGVPSEVLNVVAVFLIIIVGGLFSAANVGVGGVVTSLFAGLLWFIGMLPGAVSGIMIALALMISAMWMARQARGPQ